MRQFKAITSCLWADFNMFTCTLSLGTDQDGLIEINDRTVVICWNIWIFLCFDWCAFCQDL